jgi:hypothetical protein
MSLLDFISRACTQKSQMAIEYLPTPYMISTPGGKIVTRQVAMNPPQDISDCPRGTRDRCDLRYELDEET